MLEFSVLGPLEIRRDGVPVRVGAPKQRALLLRLLLEAGRYVSMDVLVDDLWPVQPPPGASATLRTYVSHLRRALGGGDREGSLLRSSQGRGYALVVPREAVDAGRFEQLAADGRGRMRSGDGAGAVERFDAALSLWRGEPFSDVAYEDFATAEVTRLSELYLSVHEDRFEALVDAGRHDEAVAEIDAFITANPLRERPVAQLMVGLYRAGRAPDALAAFQRFRDTLADESGLDPSPSLQALNRRILQQAPDLELTEAVPDTYGSASRREQAAEHAPVPPAEPDGQLPGRLTSIVGRSTEIERLVTFMSRSRLVTLVGPGGAGKTTLAVASARTVAVDHPDGVWFVPLAAESDPHRVGVAVAEALGVPSNVEAAERLVTARLRGRRALLLLDNCEHLADACARFVEQLLHRTDKVRVVATSREALGVPGELQMMVPPLAPPDAATLFSERAAAVRSDLDLSLYAEDIARICDRLDGMPLAIELAAARVRTITPGEIALRLDDRFGLLTAGARTAEARHQTLRGVVDWSHELLSDDERGLFRRLAVFRGGWTLQAAEAVCDPDGREEILDVLGRLVDRSLIVVRGDRFSMLETILAYAAEQLESSGEEPVLRRAHALYFADVAASAESRLRGRAQAAVLAALRADDQNLRAALAWARDHVATEPAVGLALAASLGWYWYVGRQSDGRTELSGMLATTAAAPDEVRARALQALSLALRPGGCIVHASADATDAARRSVDLFDRLGDAGRAALSRLFVAVEGVEGEQVTMHLAEVVRARDVLRNEDDPWGVALADFVEMEIRLHQADFEEALEMGRLAAAGFDALGDQWGRSAVRLHLGIGLRLAGEVEHALTVLGDAVTISRGTVLHNNLARSLYELGEAWLFRGDVDAAVGWFDEAAAVAEELGDGLLDALVSVGHGDVARFRGDPASARGHFLRAQSRLVDVTSSRTIMRVLLGEAAVALDLADPSTAARKLEAASQVADRTTDPGLWARLLEQRARLAATEEDRASAARLLADAETMRVARSRPRSTLEQRDVETLTDADQSGSSTTV